MVLFSPLKCVCVCVCVRARACVRVGVRVCVCVTHRTHLMNVVLYFHVAIIGVLTFSVEPC
jgi:hypothetical protein